MIPCNHEQNVLQDVKSKQSQFFNSLFPSRANRFGFPVYPERSFGIPSQMNVPVSFAGFSPGMFVCNMLTLLLALKISHVYVFFVVNDLWFTKLKSCDFYKKPVKKMILYHFI